MEGISAHKNQNQYDESEGVDIQLSAQETPHCPSTAVQTPADGQAVDFAQTDISTGPDDRDSMAESVTRHASTPSVILKQYGYAGRESSQSNNSLPETLPEKTEQNQDVLRVVESGRESAHTQGDILIDKLIRKIIDQIKQEDYNSYHGKSDRIEGPERR